MRIGGGHGRKNSEHSDDLPLNLEGLDDFDDDESSILQSENPFGGKKKRNLDNDDDAGDQDEEQNEFWASRVRKNTAAKGS